MEVNMVSLADVIWSILKGIKSFFQNFIAVLFYNRVVLGAFLIFLAILGFAIIGPEFTRDPYEVVKFWGVDEDKESLFYRRNQVGNTNDWIPFEFKIEEKKNTTEDFVTIRVKIVAFTDFNKTTLLATQAEFELWNGTFEQYNSSQAQLIDSMAVSISLLTEDYRLSYNLTKLGDFLLLYKQTGVEDTTFVYQLDLTATYYIYDEIIQIRKPPSLQLPLGTDDYANDVFAQLAHGTRNSLQIGFITGILVTFVAVCVGSIAGYKGGYLDEFTQLIINIAIVFPVFPLLIILASFIEERSLIIVALIIALVNWPWASRSVRSQILSLKERDFVRLARVTGMGDIKIAIVELLPNMMAYILLLTAILTGVGIIAEAGISMIGLGPDPKVYTTLGTMLYWTIANETIRSGFWWLYLPPGVVLTTFFVLLYVMQANIDEIFNPRLRKG
jgi:peptide/nickel transport system permease protein